MKKTMRSALALLLAALLLCALAAAACAEAPEEEESPYLYAEGQFFEADEEQESYYTVQVSACRDRESAERSCTKMLEAGFDCFVYETDGGYRVMCGKFRHVEDAVRYRDLIRENTPREDAYVTEAFLPASAREDFLESWKKDPQIVGDPDFNDWETPSGPFLDLTANEEETRLVYTVQYSSGTSFRAAQERRDELIALGYDAAVVKDWGCYLVLTGAFENREDAKLFRDQIRSETKHWSADVRQIELPESTLK